MDTVLAHRWHDAEAIRHAAEVDRDVVIVDQHPGGHIVDVNLVRCPPGEVNHDTHAQDHAQDVTAAHRLHRHRPMRRHADVDVEKSPRHRAVLQHHQLQRRLLPPRLGHAHVRQ